MDRNVRLMSSSEYELRASEKELAHRVDEINAAIASVDQEIGSALGNIDQPTAIVDRVHSLAVRRSTAKREMDYFETTREVDDNLKNVRLQLGEARNSISDHISNIINNKIQKMVSGVYGKHRKSPSLHIHNNTYSFSAVEDTGTGKAYSNLILLDLAIFQTTKLPFVIHDSVLFKNIENDAVARLIEIYNSLSRQSFIAIDEIEKYGPRAKTVLIEQKVIQLSNKSQLYTKDWRGS